MRTSFGVSGPSYQSGIPENVSHCLDEAGATATPAPIHLVVGRHSSELLSGSTGDDIIVAGGGADTIYGDGLNPPTGTDGGLSPGHNLILAGAGADVVFAGFGADIVLGGPGNDMIVGAGAATGGSGFIQALRADGNDLLLGDAGNDTIDGSGGRDTIFGGAGSDLIRGSYDADLLVGGLGRDHFVFGLLFSEGSPFPVIPDTGVGDGNRDVVADFRHGEDVLDLSSYRNPAGGAGTPIFLGTGAFTGTFDLQVRYEIQSDGNTLIQFAGLVGRAPNAPPEPPIPSPEGEIELIGVHHLTASDFIL
jgi:Ca2+-binding RTX toxin-like protein